MRSALAAMSMVFMDALDRACHCGSCIRAGCRETRSTSATQWSCASVSTDTAEANLATYSALASSTAAPACAFFGARGLAAAGLRVRLGVCFLAADLRFIGQLRT